jgi:hypothetical protein
MLPNSRSHPVVLEASSLFPEASHITLEIEQIYFEGVQMLT